MGNVTSLSQALTMSLTSTSSESDNDFLESCRAQTLLAELDDDDELPEPDDDDDENEDENEEDDDYDDVLVISPAQFCVFLVSCTRSRLACVALNTACLHVFRV